MSRVRRDVSSAVASRSRSSDRDPATAPTPGSSSPRPSPRASARRMGCYLITETMSPPPSAQHGVLRPALPEPGHDAARRFREPDRAAAPARAAEQREHRLRRRAIRAVPGPVGLPRGGTAHRARSGRGDRARRDAHRTGASAFGWPTSSTNEDDAAPWTRPPVRRPRRRASHGPLPPSRAGRARAAPLRREGRAALAAAQPDQAARGLPEPGVLQEAEHAPVDGAHAARHRVRGGACRSTSPCRGAVWPISRRSSASMACTLDVEDRRTSRRAARRHVPRRAHAGPGAAAARAPRHTTPACSWRRRASARPSSARTSSPRAAAARSSSCIAQPLLDQWVAQLAMFLGIDPKEIGQIGAGKRKPNGRLDVAMIQSLVRKGQVDDLVAGYGHVIVDECHHVPAVSFERVLSEVKARYVVGLTATPQRRDGHHPITEMQLGPVRFAVDAKSQAARRPVRAPADRPRDRVPDGALDRPTRASRTSIARSPATSAEPADPRRRDRSASQEGRSPILLTERKDHLEYFADRLRAVRATSRRAPRRDEPPRSGAGRPRSSPRSRMTSERLVLATGRYIGEGFDDARLDTLFLAMPVSWKGTLVQYSGRLHRRHHRPRYAFAAFKQGQFEPRGSICLVSM